MLFTLKCRLYRVTWNYSHNFLMVLVIIIILTLLIGLGGVAFVTLLERKILRLSQLRLGPNKVRLFGILQPLIDGVKLLRKNILIFSLSESFFFFFSPIVIFIVWILSWVVIAPWKFGLQILFFSSLMFGAFIGVIAYGIIITRWSSNSRFSKLGSMRRILISLSYEVVLIFIIFMKLQVFNTLIIKLLNYNISYNLFIISWTVLWVLISFIECNRAPFDLVEGERELIRGFNIEIGHISFTFLFLSEYGFILLISLLLGWINNSMVYGLILLLLIIIVRSYYPRIRYDSLIVIMWQKILPITIILFFFFVLLKC